MSESDKFFKCLYFFNETIKLYKSIHILEALGEICSNLAFKFYFEQYFKRYLKKYFFKVVASCTPEYFSPRNILLWSFVQVENVPEHFYDRKQKQFLKKLNFWRSYGKNRFFISESTLKSKVSPKNSGYREGYLSQKCS